MIGALRTKDGIEFRDFEIGVRVYAKRSLCECGFPILNDNVPLGKVYRVVEDSEAEGYKLRCGGCGTILNLTSILCQDSGNPFVFFPLPTGIFSEVS